MSRRIESFNNLADQFGSCAALLSPFEDKKIVFSAPCFSVGDTRIGMAVIDFFAKARPNATSCVVLAGGHIIGGDTLERMVVIRDARVLLPTVRSIVFARERDGWQMTVHHDRVAPEWFSSLVHALVASLVSFGDQASTTVYNVHDIKFALALVAEPLTASR
jgi:hypothetical protein